MGKSSCRKKKGGGSNRASVDNSGPTTNGGVELDFSVLLKKAHEMKEEGNRRFQNKDYAGALEHYDNALRLTPKTHPDRAVFHSNRAACLMQMKPISYETVIAECTMALEAQPQFLRAFLRRACAFEALGKYGLALQDVKALLAADPTNSHVLEFSQRLQTALVSHSLQRHPSPAAVADLGPCFPARPGPTNVGNSALLKPVLKTSNISAKSPNSRKENQKEQFHDVAVRFRPLKFVYDHDIRLVRMPMNCNFRVLRELVSKTFPSSKSVLIKYKDNDDDLVTITSSEELRFAESIVDSNLLKRDGADKSDSVGMLRLNIVEISPEQEPSLLEEEEVEIKGNENDNRSNCSPGEGVSEEVEKDASKEKAYDTDCKEMEMDDWLFEFAQLFRSHIGVDQNAHVDLHELGMEFCSEALEETVTSEETQCLFEKASSKFQEVAALAFFNWGNVHMCAARKRVALDESVGKEVVAERLQVAYDWVKEKYCLAKEKYEQALLIKPDFYEGLLALGQQQFEMAKLHWSFVLAKNIDLSAWDSAETLQLFTSAEEKMKAATDMWEKLEEQRINELKDPNAFASKKEELLKRRKKQASDTDGIGGQGDMSAEEAAEQAAVMRSQIHIFLGNMLFERSQVECKLGMIGWKKNLDVAVEHFKLAGASVADISMVVKNHCSNGDAREGEIKGSRAHNPLNLIK